MNATLALNKRALCFAGVIVVLAVACYVRSADWSAASQAQTAEDADATSLAALAPDPAQVELAARREQIVASPWPASPFVNTGPDESPSAQPQAPASAQQSDGRSPAAGFVLRAIFNGKPPRAMIDDRIVGVGDQLSDKWRITEIGAYDVRLEADGAAFTLTLQK